MLTSTSDTCRRLTLARLQPALALRRQQLFSCSACPAEAAEASIPAARRPEHPRPIGRWRSGSHLPPLGRSWTEPAAASARGCGHKETHGRAEGGHLRRGSDRRRGWGQKLERASRAAVAAPSLCALWHGVPNCGFARDGGTAAVASGPRCGVLRDVGGQEAVRDFVQSPALDRDRRLLQRLKSLDLVAQLLHFRGGSIKSPHAGAEQPRSSRETSNRCGPEPSIPAAGSSHHHALFLRGRICVLDHTASQVKAPPYAAGYTMPAAEHTCRGGRTMLWAGPPLHQTPTRATYYN